MGGINPTWAHFPKPNWSQHKSTYRCDIAITITLRGKPLVRIDSPLVLLLLPSTGLKWMVGMGHTSCMGLASTRELLFLSHPAPSRNNPRIHTPSCGVAGFDKHSRCSKITMVTNDLKGFTMSHKHQLPAHTLKGILIPRLEDCLTMRLAYCNQWAVQHTLGCSVMLLSSNVDTWKSQDSESTDTCVCAIDWMSPTPSKRQVLL